MRLDAIRIGDNPPEDVNVVIEVPLGGEPIKYEMDKDAGTVFVDRFLYTSMRYPGNYGFVPHTLAEDGDPSTSSCATGARSFPAASSTAARSASSSWRTRRAWTRRSSPCRCRR